VDIYQTDGSGSGNGVNCLRFNWERVSDDKICLGEGN
jgi:hypothetical protein